MGKILDCTYRNDGCRFSAEADTEEDALQEVAAHIRNEHDGAITSDLVTTLRADIRDG